MTTVTGSACEACGKWLLDESPLGRRRRFCDARCRSRARRQRAAEMLDDPSLQPFAQAIRRTVEHSGRSLRELSKLMENAGYSVSASALSQWGKGHHVPYPSDAIRHRLFMLERLASTPRGGLAVALLATTRASGRLQPAVPRPRSASGSGQRTMDDARAQLLERIAFLDGSDWRNLVQVGQTEQYVIGEIRMPLRSDMTLTVVPLVGGIDRYWHVYAYDPQAPVSIEVGEDEESCTKQLVLDDIPPVRINSRTRYQLAATELRFKRPLPVGQPRQFSFSMCYHPEVAAEPTPEPELRRFVTTPATQELRIGITFHPNARPRELWRTHWASGPPTNDPVEQVLVAVEPDGTSEPIVESDPPLGSYGYRWIWPNDRQVLP